MARASNRQRYGGTSHETPTTSPSARWRTPWRAAPGGRFPAPPAVPDQKELVGGIAFAKQILAGIETMIARAAGDDLSQLRIQAGEERMRQDDAFKSLHAGPPSFCRGWLDRGHFLGDVDADRAPGDAAAAADAARGAELVDPARQLVRHPLAIARLPFGPHAAAMDVGKIQREARIPAFTRSAVWPVRSL